MKSKMQCFIKFNIFREYKLKDIISLWKKQLKLAQNKHYFDGPKFLIGLLKLFA